MSKLAKSVHHVDPTDQDFVMKSEKLADEFRKPTECNKHNLDEQLTADLESRGMSGSVKFRALSSDCEGDKENEPIPGSSCSEDDCSSQDSDDCTVDDNGFLDDESIDSHSSGVSVTELTKSDESEESDEGGELNDENSSGKSGVRGKLKILGESPVGCDSVGLNDKETPKTKSGQKIVNARVRHPIGFYSEEPSQTTKPSAWATQFVKINKGGKRKRHDTDEEEDEDEDEDEDGEYINCGVFGILLKRQKRNGRFKYLPTWIPNIWVDEDDMDAQELISDFNSRDQVEIAKRVWAPTNHNFEVLKSPINSGESIPKPTSQFRSHGFWLRGLGPHGIWHNGFANSLSNGTDITSGSQLAGGPNTPTGSALELPPTPSSGTDLEIPIPPTVQTLALTND